MNFYVGKNRKKFTFLSSPLTLLVLSACGGRSSDSGYENYSGFVIKGPLENALVFLDYNGDGVLGADETSVRTGADGSFSLGRDVAGLSFVAQTDSMTVDKSSGEVLDNVVLKAPSGASVVTPATTIMVEAGVTKEEVSKVLGVSGVNVHNSENADLVHNTSYLNSAYSSIWGLPASSNIGITTVHDDGGYDHGEDNQGWNNLGIVDGALNGKAVSLATEYRTPNGEGPLNPGGGGNATGTISGGTIRYNDDLISLVPDFYLSNGKDLILENAGYLNNYEVYQLSPEASSILANAGVDTTVALFPKLDAVGESQLSNILQYDINGVARNLNQDSVGALEVYDLSLLDDDLLVYIEIM